MTTARIKSMALQNFKGISCMNIAFDARREDIRAKNGSGKTTLMYAWQWVLGIDVPDVIPKLNNQELHNLETRVTVVLDIDGYEYRLSRTQTEEWKTNRATGIEEKHTNKSAYAIDDVEFTLTNYKEKLTSLFGVAYEKVEMLTNKDYFNTDKAPKWTWTARRKELFDLTGTAALLKGLAHKSDYELISEDLRKGFSASEIRKAKMKALKATTDDKERNITIIGEKQNDVAKYAAIDFAALEAQKAGYEDKITQLNLAILKAEKNGDAGQIMVKIDELMTEVKQLSIADQNERNRLANAADSAVIARKKLERYAEELNAGRIDVDDLTSRYLAKKASRWQGDTVCPTCGQALPLERVEKAKQQFETAKAEDLRVLETKIAEGAERNKAIDAELQELQENLADLKAKEGIAVAELDNFETNPKIAAINAEISALKAQNGTAVEVVAEAEKTELAYAKARVAELQEQLVYRRVVDDLKTRIEELKALNRLMTDKEMTLRGAIAQLDAYVAEQVGLVTDTINGLFGNGISFALFSENYAGAESELKETCVCMLNGKVYSSMSTGEKFIANLQVTRALQKAYGVNLPLFCDNAECFTEDLDADQQIITLSAVSGRGLENCVQVQNENFNHTEV